jgi:hypothetical protein
MQQLTIDFKARDRAINQSMTAATSRDPSFSERAQALILKRLETQGEASGEWLTNECKLAGIAPKDDRAFGGVFQSLIKQNAIQKIGSCARAKGHGTSGGSIYTLATCNDKN